MGKPKANSFSVKIGRGLSEQHTMWILSKILILEGLIVCQSSTVESGISKLLLQT